MDTIGTGLYMLSVLRAGWEGNLGYGMTFGTLLRIVALILLTYIAKTTADLAFSLPGACQASLLGLDLVSTRSLLGIVSLLLTVINPYFTITYKPLFRAVDPKVEGSSPFGVDNMVFLYSNLTAGRNLSRQKNKH